MKKFILELIFDLKYAKENRKILEELKNEYVKNALLEKNPFIRDMLSLQAEFIYIDSDVFFSKISSRGNIFSKKQGILKEEGFKRFYKLLSMYYTMNIFNKKRNQLNIDEIKDGMIRVFQFNENDIKLFDIIYRCNDENFCGFWGFYSKVLLKYIMGIDKVERIWIAFIENFCYNSFKIFMRYYTKYISFSRRIELQ